MVLKAMASARYKYMKLGTRASPRSLSIQPVGIKQGPTKGLCSTRPPGVKCCPGGRGLGGAGEGVPPPADTLLGQHPSNPRTTGPGRT
eukprot:3642139-Heterocapsa_arctica.AAC.1